MKQRAITALFFVAAMVGGIFWGRETFLGLFWLIVAGALWELFGMLLPADEPGLRWRKIAGCLIGFLPVWWFGYATLLGGFCGHSTPGEIAAAHVYSMIGKAGECIVLVVIPVMLAFIHELFRGGKNPAQVIGSYLLGVFYVSLPVMLLFWIATPDAYYKPNRVFGLLWLVWTNDTLAYLVGSRIGKNKLFERISPKKTWEGTIGGIVGTIAMAWVLAQYVPDFSPAQWLALGGVVSIFGTLGDLVESMLKRSAGVKDSGSLFPGHGGFLDRFDAFLFMLPFAWLAVVLLGG